MLATHGVAVRPVVRTRQVVAAAQLAAAGLGVAFVPTAGLPATGLTAAGSGGVLRRLAPPASREIVALTTGERDVLARRFVADLQARSVPLPAAVRAALAP